MTWLLAVACGVATIPAGLRWLRVAQREHYLAPSVSRFAWRWWTSGPVNVGLFMVAIVGVAGTLVDPLYGFLVAVAQIGPRGLSVKGVSSPLGWTGRLRHLAVVVGVVVLIIYLVGGLVRAPLLVVAGLFALPLIIDSSLALMAPVEKNMGTRWVTKAAGKLQTVGADVVAITGSYGKTTTKNYVAHLLAGSKRTVASPASFNNRMGLARAINENLVPGTEVFVAEMGAYGPGEIAELCEWIPPKVAAMVAIGPVHLERFKSEERIVAAKAEILHRAEIGVICVDHPLLAELARERGASMRIVEVSTTGGQITADGTALAPVPEGAFGANAAVAVGIGLAIGVSSEDLLARLSDLPVAEHRQSVGISDVGFSIIDDTFNSNPAGAAQGLQRLGDLGSGGLTVVVTPGMVELGSMQGDLNEAFARNAAEMVDHFFIVGRTNRKALLKGSTNQRASVTVVDSRNEAVGWVRSNLGPGDVVLYENDLPDHYP